jgi:hypothetical protein
MWRSLGTLTWRFSCGEGHASGLSRVLPRVPDMADWSCPKTHSDRLYRCGLAGVDPAAASHGCVVGESLPRSSLRTAATWTVPSLWPSCGVGSTTATLCPQSTRYLTSCCWSSATRAGCFSGLTSPSRGWLRSEPSIVLVAHDCVVIVDSSIRGKVVMCVG